MIPILLLLMGLVPLSGQVLVYKIEVESPKGVNFQPFEGGYAVVPLLGGQASFVLTQHDSGREYVVVMGAGSFFTAVNGGTRKNALFVNTGSEGASGAIVAMGDIDHTVRISNRTLTLSAKVAKTLKGTLMSADSEQDIAVSQNGQDDVGSVGIAEIKLTLEEGETDRANEKGSSQDAVLEALKLELERRGYSAAGSGSPDDEGDQESGNANSGTNAASP